MRAHSRLAALGVAVLLLTAASPPDRSTAPQRFDERASGGASQQDGHVVPVPPVGDASLEHLGDGTPVWVVSQPDGEVDVLAVGVLPIPPEASSFVGTSSVQGVRSPVLWVPEERAFIGGSVLFEADGRSVGWFPIQVGGAEDAEPVVVRDLDAYDAQPAGDGSVRVGDRRTGEERTVPANPDFPSIFEEGTIVRPLEQADGRPPLPVEEARSQPDGTVVLVDGDVVVDGTTPPRVCEVPDVPVGDLPPCPDDAPEPPDVTARDPDPRAYTVEFGPYLVRVGDGTFTELIGGSGNAGRFAGSERPPGGFDDDPSTLQRVEGATPAELAVAVSRERFRDGEAFVAVLARDDVAADSVTGAVLTADGPLLFTGRDALPQATLDELRRVVAPEDPEAGLPPGVVYLLGGEAAIGPAVERALSDAGFSPVRLAGASRVETAIAVAGAARSNGPGGAIPELMLARADAPPGDPTRAWADAVAGGGWAATWRMPVLLTPGDALHPAVAAALADFRTTSTVLLGGTAALSEQVAAAVPAPRRIDGGDRVGTAAAIATDLWRFGSGRFVLFDGHAEDGWAAALTGAGLSADFAAPLLLTGGDGSLPPSTTAAIERSCAWRSVDALVIGDASAPTALDACPGPAPAGVDLEVTVDSRTDTFEEDAVVVATLRNGTAAPLSVERSASVADVERLDDGGEVYLGVLPGSGEEVVEVAPGEAVEVLRSAPFPGPPPGQGGTTTAGRYTAAVRTSAGLARTEFFIELS